MAPGAKTHPEEERGESRAAHGAGWDGGAERSWAKERRATERLLTGKALKGGEARRETYDWRPVSLGLRRRSTLSLRFRSASPHGDRAKGRRSRCERASTFGPGGLESTRWRYWLNKHLRARCPRSWPGSQPVIRQRGWGREAGSSCLSFPPPRPAPRRMARTSRPLIGSPALSSIAFPFFDRKRFGHLAVLPRARRLGKKLESEMGSQPV